jgi:transmembrane sensor
MNTQQRSPREIEDLIRGFLRRQVTREEIKVLEKWIEEHPSNRALFHKINTAFQLHPENQDGYQHTDEAWKNVSQTIEGVSERKKTILLQPSRFSLLKIAAAVTILLMAGAIASRYFTGELTPASDEAVTLQAEQIKKRLVLPDGTVVWLNANSSIQYASGFGTAARKVILQGEAFFDVAKTGIDFIVQTENLSIQVKGTRFNVAAFGSGKECATLEEGRVVLKVKDGDVFDMRPGEQVTFDHQSNAVSLKTVNPMDYSVWKEDPLEFRQASLREILRAVEARYHVTIQIEDRIATRENISMTIQEETLEEVLELIGISASLRYDIQGKEVRIYE